MFHHRIIKVRNRIGDVNFSKMMAVSMPKCRFADSDEDMLLAFLRHDRAGGMIRGHGVRAPAGPDARPATSLHRINAFPKMQPRYGPPFQSDIIIWFNGRLDPADGQPDQKGDHRHSRRLD